MLTKVVVPIVVAVIAAVGGLLYEDMKAFILPDEFPSGVCCKDSSGLGRKLLKRPVQTSIDIGGPSFPWGNSKPLESFVCAEEQLQVLNPSWGEGSQVLYQFGNGE